LASFALAPRRAQRLPNAKAPQVRAAGLDPGRSPPIQTKLEVGPSHDRFEAEADRVAQSILSSAAGPSSSPAISPLGSSSATRKPLQREESRPIEKREEDKTEQKKKALTHVLQPKKQEGVLEDLKKGATPTAQKKSSPAPKPRKDEKVQKKGLDGATMQAKAAPKPQDEHKKAQKKSLNSALLQAKANPRPREDQTKNAQKKPLSAQRASAKPTKDDKKAQKKPLTGVFAQTKADPRPREDETKKGQKKAVPGARLQTKPASKRREEPKKVQKKSLSGTLQRDDSDVDDDTILETSIQPKRLSGALQREVAKAKADLEPEQKEEPKKPSPLQRAAASADGFTAPAAVEAGITSMQGGGEPLAPDIRSDLEPRFGRDLSGVRIHHGSRASDLSHSVQARAFTIGQDVFFGAGQYQPHTSGGRALLAHELTHTIQQRGGSSRAQKSRIQRVKKAKDSSVQTPAKSTDAGGKGTKGTDTQDPHTFEEKGVGKLQIDGDQKIIKMDGLPVPKLGPKGARVWKGAGPGAVASGKKPKIPESISVPWPYLGKTHRGPTTARQKWLDHWKTPPGGITKAIGKLMQDNPSGQENHNKKEIAYLRLSEAKATGKNLMLIGTQDELAITPEILLPIWNRNGNGALFDVDHIQELQLGGADDFSNFWLLDQGTNRSSGSNIAREMKGDFIQLITAARGAGAFTDDRLGTQIPEWDKIRSEDTNATYPWKLQYGGIREIKISGTEATWTVDEIEGGTHVEQLTAMGEGEIMKKGLVYAASAHKVTARFFALPTGGFFRTVNYKDPQNVVTTDELEDAAAGTGSGVAGNQFYKGLAVAKGGIKMTTTASEGKGEKERARLGAEPKEKLKDGDVIATISGQPFPASGKITADPLKDIPVKWKEQFGYGGYVDKGWINERLARLSIVGASPIEVQEAGLTPQGELFANGVINATKAIFPDLRIPIFLRGNEIFVRFPIPTDKLNFGPVHVTDAAIDIGYGLHGLFLGGRAVIVVDHVGEGTIEAKTTSSDTIISGKFMFNMDFLKDPSAEFKYSFAKDTFELTLKTDVEKRKLPGVDAGHVEGTFSREAVSLTGTLDLAPPLQGSQLILGYTPKDGIVIAANDIPLPIGKIPGVKEAKLSARVTINPDDGEWHVSGTGSAMFSMPPVSGSLLVALDGRQLLINGSIGFQQGIASGSVTVTATNAEVDDKGQPIPDKIADKWSIWGSGSASLKFGILTGTAGLKLNPDGSVIIDGEIALPPVHKVFERKDYNKQLLHVEPPEFPIWGVSVAGYGIGIFGFVDAKLNFDAYVGPGTLNDTKVKVTFALDKPEEAVVDGNAAFVVPAGAGFTLDIGGGLRARAAVGYVQGRVGLDARLGLEAEARADVSVHWSQIEGLSLAAKAHAEAHPRFDIGVNASVTAGVDLLVTEVEHTWGPWRKQLGSFGPEMSVGITAPIAWSEKTGLDFSTDKIEITKPDIDFPAVMKDAFLELV
jgi:hypothetical protein